MKLWSMMEPSSQSQSQWHLVVHYFYKKVYHRCLTKSLTLYFIMLKNGQTYFKCDHRKIFKACLAIFQHYEMKG